MESQQIAEPFCQSCGMPMKKTEDFGINADGTRSKDYCQFCFHKEEKWNNRSFKNCLQRTANMVQNIFIQTLRASFAPRTLSKIFTANFMIV
jgi:hypothetical protein